MGQALSACLRRRRRAGAGSNTSGLLDRCRFSLLGVRRAQEPQAGDPDKQPQPVTPSGNPLPEVVHLRLTTQSGALRGGGRTIVCGDVHGCAAELRALLAAVGFVEGQDNLIFTGDLITKGPYSQQARGRARLDGQRASGAGRYGAVCVPLAAAGNNACALAPAAPCAPQVVAAARELGAWSARGNNDDAALAARAAWERGEAITDPKFAFVSGLEAGDVAYLSQLPFSVSLPEYGAVVVHGGLVPGVPLCRQQLWAICVMRVLLRVEEGVWLPYDGDKTLTPLGSVPWATAWPGPAHCLFGHDSARGLQLTACATGLDTACATGGALTAAVLPPVEELQRDEAFVRKLRAREPIGFADLRGRLVSVPSQQPRPPPPPPGAAVQAF
ncbi:hypothetical protein Rsub_12300 [Raphidocelis subcapitata]|uniref:Calcineurin-like phosphoesterase domain-containing protein n=1 Tax=Raphidocelis subcapitata TaxID=307507 RepID=A0A2V0PII8_9CHLO|nr:hypothetical protein Rsub_12300 [Raphidocelis subcapitata]|eukprot:GBF99621.1 hypothetical protein Rsub_12300 [Raphidocelis subcapitata]